MGMEERHIFIFLLFLMIPAFNLVLTLFDHKVCQKSYQKVDQKKAKSLILNLWIGVLFFNILLILGRVIEKKTGEWVLFLPMMSWLFFIKFFYQIYKKPSLKIERFIIIIFYLHLLLFPLGQTGLYNYFDESYLTLLFLISSSLKWWGWEQKSTPNFQGDFKSLSSEEFFSFLESFYPESFFIESFSKNFELGLLAPSIIHQIQNPLMIILAKGCQLQRLLHRSLHGSSHGHEERELKEKIQEGLDQMMKSGERIKKTLEIYREMIYEQSSAPKEKISLREILDEVMCLCEQRFQNHGVSFRTFEVNDQFIWGHKAQVEEVFFNLYQNSFESIEFLPDKWIETSCRVEGPFLNVYIQDSGKGEELRYQKLSNQREHFSLFLSAKIMKDLGGEIFFLKEKKRPTILLRFPRIIISDEIS